MFVHNFSLQTFTMATSNNYPECTITGPSRLDPLWNNLYNLYDVQWLTSAWWRYSSLGMKFWDYFCVIFWEIRSHNHTDLKCTPIFPMNCSLRVLIKGYTTLIRLSVKSFHFSTSVIYCILPGSEINQARMY